MTPTGEVRAHLAAALAGVGATVYDNPVGVLTAPCVALIWRGSTPTAGWQATEEAFDVEVSVPLAGGRDAIPLLDELAWAVARALAVAGVLVERLDGYDPRPDVSHLTTVMPTRTTWKDIP